MLLLLEVFRGCCLEWSGVMRETSVQGIRQPAHAAAVSTACVLVVAVAVLRPAIQQLSEFLCVCCCQQVSFSCVAAPLLLRM